MDYYTTLKKLYINYTLHIVLYMLIYKISKTDQVQVDSRVDQDYLEDNNYHN